MIVTAIVVMSHQFPTQVPHKNQVNAYSLTASFVSADSNNTNTMVPPITAKSYQLPKYITHQIGSYLLTASFVSANAGNYTMNMT